VTERATDPLDRLARLHLAHLPTPIIKVQAIDDRLGCDVWIKRDDATGGAEAGNKIRKLELLLADAIAKGCDTVLTCGGIQSNHARATALLCARLGLKCVVFLRVLDLSAPLPLSGNVLLDRMAGAEVHAISKDQYRDRNQLMADAARTLTLAGRKPYVIPEGGSNALGSIGYVLAMREVREQLDLGLAGGPRPFDVVAHACGSGGTAAGVAIGIARHRVAERAIAYAVCDDGGYFLRRIGDIIDEARATFDFPMPAYEVDDAAKGPAYAVSTDEQRAFIVELARTSGLVFDPVYTGKAIFGLSLAIKRGDIAPGARVLFLHTGGLPGLLAEPETFGPEVGATPP